MDARASARKPRGGWLSCHRSRAVSPRLLLWPEAAVTDPLEDARTDEHQAIANFERTRAASLLGPGEYLLTGGIAVVSKDGLLLDGAANSVFVLAPGGRSSAATTRRISCPMANICRCGRSCRRSACRGSRRAISISPPGRARARRSPRQWGKVGFQLCYEIIFSGEVVDRRNRPDFIFNPSNDAWFGRWGPPQHLAQARLRAAEEGIPVIRSTPTGISAVIDAHGHVVKVAAVAHRGRHRRRLPPAATSPTAVRALRQYHPAAARLRADRSAALCLGARRARGAHIKTSLYP